mgnify:FL=1|jgi:hypothetical protein|tara:strand:- start:409 stop:549 length:141 start_codon:yes stop_codon:yes gene_type:complete
MNEEKNITCNWCDLLLEEDDLLRMEDKDGSLDACPNCKTDEYLMDL